MWDLGETKNLNVRGRGFGEIDEEKRGEERFRKAIERVARMSIHIYGNVIIELITVETMKENTES